MISLNTTLTINKDIFTAAAAALKEAKLQTHNLIQN